MNNLSSNRTSVAQGPVKWTLLAVGAAALVACGGGGGGGGGSLSAVGSGGTGFVTGFGSVIVDGITYDDSALDNNGAVRSEDGATDVSSTRTAVRLGQRLEVELNSNGTAVTSALIASELQGPVTAVAQAGATRFEVAGQAVTINTDPLNGPVTVLEGATAISEFALGDRVEVHGELLADGSSIRASRIERKPATSTANTPVTTVKLSGLVSNLSANRDRFQVGNVVVTVNTATAIRPATATLQNGQRVKVFAPSLSNNAVSASGVRIKQFNQDRADFRIRGVVAATPAPTRTQFVIGGVTVDASTLNLNFDIVAGRSYRVRGTYTAATNTVRASEVQTSSSDAVSQAELKGSVTDFISASNFRVRGVLVDATTVLGAATLQNGEFVEIKGTANSSGVVVARSLERKSPASGNELELKGNLSNLNTSARTFNLGARVVSYANATFEDGAVADLANGRFVEADGRLNGDTLVARKVEFKDGSNSTSGSTAAAAEREVEGRLAQDATLTGTDVVRFTVSGVNLTCTNGSFNNLCSTTQLRRGVKVEVRFNATNVVTRLKRDD